MAHTQSMQGSTCKSGVANTKSRQDGRLKSLDQQSAGTRVMGAKAGSGSASSPSLMDGGRPFMLVNDFSSTFIDVRNVPALFCVAGGA